jgi:hypothetical protein
VCSTGIDVELKLLEVTAIAGADEDPSGGVTGGVGLGRGVASGPAIHVVAELDRLTTDREKRREVSHIDPRRSGRLALLRARPSCPDQEHAAGKRAQERATDPCNGRASKACCFHRLLLVVEYDNRIAVPAADPSTSAASSALLARFRYASDVDGTRSNSR